MKNKISIIGLIGALILAAFVGGKAAQEFGWMGGFAVTALLFAIALLKPFIGGRRIPNVYGADLQKEVWQDHIEGNLFKDNEFLMASTDASQYVTQGKIVHIPQAGGVVGVQKNRSSFPATVTTRTDTEVTYTLAPYTTDPIKLPNAEKYELSYNKRESVLSESEAVLRERIADEMLITWSPSAAGNIIRTTGDIVATHVAATTGSRRSFKVKDLKTAQKVLNKQKGVSKLNRYALFSADMYDQFTDDMTLTQTRDFSMGMDPKTGVVGQLYGFKIMVRSDTVIYNTDGSAVNAYGAAVAATDNDTVLCWQQSAIERAVGDITMFGLEGDPTQYGDVYSFEVRFGGRKRRSDEVGIIAIVQGTAAGV